MMLLRVTGDGIYLFENPTLSTAHDRRGLCTGDILVEGHRIERGKGFDYLERYTWIFVLAPDGRFGWVAESSRHSKIAYLEKIR